MSTVEKSRTTVRSASPVVPFLPIIVVGLIHLGAILLSLHGLAEWTKPLLMPALATGLIWGAPQRRSPAIVLGVVALFFSWVGDVTIPWWFVVGLVFFLLAHITYLVLFVSRLAVRRVQWWAIAYVVWLVVLLMILGPHTGSLLVPVIAYGIVLSAMAAFASRCNRWVAWGGALFVVSDSLLAINRFLPDAGIPLADFLIMVTYIAAQTLIVWGLLRHERARAATA
ncbi:lysoplasmalogenase [Cryobacterium zongtaii]|uniref:lysoplasmalogenase n=1 Tax=Cryobacterium zongtaii TaxID=1259217 RepID=UPI001056E527|nr:lysoplasmalogenase [Cryobacterium zongtaii]